MNLSTVFASIILLAAVVSGQYETGTGTRAAALANNHTALESGVPDLYWNPGALAFSVTREFQLSLYGNRLSSKSTFFENGPSESRVPRYGFGNAGISYALPARRGGMSIAGSFSSPILLDDAFTFSGSYEEEDGTVVDVRERIYRMTGALKFWTAGFGMQIAPNLGIGISGSIVTGKSDARDELNKAIGVNDAYQSDIYRERLNGTYLGYDTRIGILYKMGALQTGARLVFPRTLNFTEKFSDSYESSTDKFKMYSSFSGAWGVSSTLPFCTISAELRTTMPFDIIFPLEEIPSSSQASYFKTGGGAGIEVPLIGVPVITRLGYSYDELDVHQWIYVPNESDDDLSIDWDVYDKEFHGMDPHGLHRISAGVGFTSETTAFDMSYTLSMWSVTTLKNLEQRYLMHRILTSFTVRF